MSSHHDNHNNHSEETKPVAFRAPMILGLVTLLAILLLVSTCDKKHGCCEDETKCEGHKKHHDDAEATVEEAHASEATKTEETPVVESLGTVDSLGNFVYNLGEMEIIDINGATINVGKNSTEAKLYAFLSNKDAFVDTVDKTKGWISLDRVYFEKGKAQLTKESMTQIKNLGVILKAFPTATVKIGGYTDNTGTEAINIKVSGERAVIVLKELTKDGIAANRLKSEGYGPLHPIASNETPEGMAQNRRVDIRITKK